MKTIQEHPWFETLCVGCTVYMIARDYSKEVKMSIASIIKNRMLKKYFSDGTILGTIFYPYQFSCWGVTNENRLELLQSFNQGIINENKLVLECFESCDNIFTNKKEHNTDIIYYVNNDKEDETSYNISNLSLVNQIDSFKFYKI